MQRTVMSKTLAILLGLALVWLGAWTLAGYYMAEAGSEKLARSDHVSTPATRLEPGAEIRVEGTILEGPTAVAPYSEKACLAALTRIAVRSTYRDSHNKDVRNSNLIAMRRVGPANIRIDVGGERIELPLERWTPRLVSFEPLDEIPPRLGVTREEIARAEAEARGTLGRYEVSEAMLDAGARFFVVGRLEDGAGSLRLEADRVLGRIELYPGSQEELVEELRSGGAGLRVAGWILGAGVGPFPLAILGLVFLVRHLRSSRHSATDPRP